MTAAELINVVIEGKLQESIRRRSSIKSSSTTRTLSQKQGARKGARTRERRQYVR